MGLRVQKMKSVIRDQNERTCRINYIHSRKIFLDQENACKRLTGAIESKNRKVQIGPKLTWCVELLSSLRHASFWTNEIASKGVRRGHKVWNRGHTFRSTLITEIGDGKYCSTVGWLVFKMAWKEWKGVGKSKGVLPNQHYYTREQGRTITKKVLRASYRQAALVNYGAKRDFRLIPINDSLFPLRIFLFSEKA